MRGGNNYQIKRERIIKLIVVLLILVMAMSIVLLVENMLVSFVIAFVISYLLSPLVSLLERTGLSRNMAVVIPFLGVGTILTAAIYILIPVIDHQLASIRSEIPTYIEGTTRLISKTEQYLNEFAGAFHKFDIATTVQNKLVQWSASIFQNIPTLLSKFFTVSLLAPLFAFFMLRDGKGLFLKLLELVPNNLFELALHLQHQINSQLGGFVRARLLESAIVGGVVWVGLASIGFPYSLLLGITAAITNLIPYIGPFIGAVPTVILAFVNQTSGMTLTLVAIVYLVSQIIDMVVIIPLVVARIVNLHPVTVILAIIIGSEIMGILGMIISIPITSIIKLTGVSIYNHLLGFRASDRV